jgi:hypothetical protein
VVGKRGRGEGNSKKMDETVNISPLSSSKNNFLYFFPFLPWESLVELSPGKERISEEETREISFEKRKRKDRESNQWQEGESSQPEL